MNFLNNSFCFKNCCHGIEITCSRHVRFHVILCTIVFCRWDNICVSLSFKVNAELLHHLCSNMYICPIYSGTRQMNGHTIDYSCHEQCTGILAAPCCVDSHFHISNSFRMYLKRKMTFFF